MIQSLEVGGAHARLIGPASKKLTSGVYQVVKDFLNKGLETRFYPAPEHPKLKDGEHCYAMVSGALMIPHRAPLDEDTLVLRFNPDAPEWGANGLTRQRLLTHLKGPFLMGLERQENFGGSRLNIPRFWGLFD